MPSRSRLTSTRVLIADQDRPAAELMKLGLQAHGCQVLTAASVVEAQSLIEAERPDVLVLAVSLPEGTEGLELVWKLRKRDEAYYRDVPVIMLTTVQHESSAGLLSGHEFVDVQEFVRKPVEGGQLADLIARVSAGVH